STHSVMSGVTYELMPAHEHPGSATRALGLTSPAPIASRVSSEIAVHGSTSGTVSGSGGGGVTVVPLRTTVTSCWLHADSAVAAKSAAASKRIVVMCGIVGERSARTSL